MGGNPSVDKPIVSDQDLKIGKDVIKELKDSEITKVLLKIIVDYLIIPYPHQIKSFDPIKSFTNLGITPSTLTTYQNLLYIGHENGIDIYNKYNLNIKLKSIREVGLNPSKIIAIENKIFAVSNSRFYYFKDNKFFKFYGSVYDQARRPYEGVGTPLDMSYVKFDGLHSKYIEEFKDIFLTKEQKEDLIKSLYETSGKIIICGIYGIDIYCLKKEDFICRFKQPNIAYSCFDTKVEWRKIALCDDKIFLSNQNDNEFSIYQLPHGKFLSIKRFHHGKSNNPIKTMFSYKIDDILCLFILKENGNIQIHIDIDKTRSVKKWPKSDISNCFFDPDVGLFAINGDCIEIY